MKTKINVLVVDDSAFMRKVISDFLEEDPRVKVVGTARNGLDAIEKIEKLKPDVVTLDVEMPIMNGIDALKEIMKKNPLPVIMVSSTTKEGAENTVTAMDFGAIDFVAKPSGAISLDIHKIKQILIDKVKLAAHANVHNLTPKNSMVANYPTFKKIHMSNNEHRKKIVLIGTSTGGPKALQEVLTKLPSDIDAPIVVVQHMPAGFTKSLAYRLHSLSQITVKEAEDGEIIKNGFAYIAPGGYHLKVKQSGSMLTAQLNKDEPRNSHRPSVDVMFESVAELDNFLKIAVIMTGMGSDGTEGLLSLKKSGAEEVVAIAESEESSVVFGMPKAAILSNQVDQVVHLQQIAEVITKYCARV
ncbi:chemotaxis response regulator protein-glutamate methylesterase [Anaerobacillus sp. MEB173]|uniref:protein-glutamate methylesterase/protein-glutamine glutaminase n=1 Tax=Anaerobacillus sp. MEB173 TaxID=3383345 RepID=UPI003F932A67